MRAPKSQKARAFSRRDYVPAVVVRTMKFRYYAKGTNVRIKVIVAADDVHFYDIFCADKAGVLERNN